MECHKCEHQADVQAGRYAGLPWDVSPCASCTFEERDSSFTMAFDPEHEGEGSRPVVAQHQEAYVPLSAVVSLLAMLWDMPEKVQKIIRGRLAKRTYADIGRELGISGTRVEWLQQRAMARWPALRVMFPVKMARARRKEAEMEENREELDQNRRNSGGNEDGGGLDEENAERV